MPTKTEVARAASAFLSLSSLDDLLANAEAAKNLLAKKTDSPVAAAAKAWKAAADDAIEHVLLVVRNNPGRTLDEILARPDVKMALSKPFGQAGENTAALIQKAWNQGWVVGGAAAKKDLSVLGLGTTSSAKQGESGVLPKLLQDAADNASKAQQRLTDAMLSTDHGGVEDALRAVLNDLGRRAKMGVDVARTRASTEAQIATYQKAAEKTGKAIFLVWVTRFRPTTCAACAALHGMTVPLGGSFDPAASFSGYVPGTYVDLAGPPRHPNCGCHIVAYLGSAPPKSMTSWAQAWWKKQVT